MRDILDKIADNISHDAKLEVSKISRVLDCGRTRAMVSQAVDTRNSEGGKSQSSCSNKWHLSFLQMC